ncbi:phosphodiester glycosidase family protein [Hymenobacter sp. YC55]|uniref:phosphodiester glycosidase family protein n=1 Tax=Hymenobacter sp. YC55 TaxID=3034019 RepID=UPI0023F63E99|nr:phosphodiester glycosidase family protein [Hymenobacter sp. YC55]MDF7811680.1 phosphodiester glycosidase family protein [Hymenobacter sp. YC55]
MAKRLVFLLLLAGALLVGFLPFVRHQSADSKYVSYRADLRKDDLKLYWKDEHGQLFRSLGSLESWLSAKGKQLKFAMNGGMYKAGNIPVGLFIQEQRVLAPLNTATGTGNFYLTPNGIFYVTIDNKVAICRTEAFPGTEKIRFATQSGPLLVIDGRIHPAFNSASQNLNIRNGIGILPDGSLLLVMSREKVNFYEFAAYFRAQGCRNALYLDGFVSRAYAPEKEWLQTDGDFGVIIGLTAR